MRILRLDLEAVDEMEEAAEWYEQRQQGLARRFLDEIERLQETIVERPASYPVSTYLHQISSSVGRCSPDSHMP